MFVGTISSYEIHTYVYILYTYTYLHEYCIALQKRFVCNTEADRRSTAAERSTSGGFQFEERTMEIYRPERYVSGFATHALFCCRIKSMLSLSLGTSFFTFTVVMVENWKASSLNASPPCWFFSLVRWVAMKPNKVVQWYLQQSHFRRLCPKRPSYGVVSSGGWAEGKVFVLQNHLFNMRRMKHVWGRKEIRASRDGLEKGIHSSLGWPNIYERLDIKERWNMLYVGKGNKGLF